MQIAQRVAPTKQANGTAVSANDAIHRLSRKERREQSDVRQKWLHKKMTKAVSATITPTDSPKKNLVGLKPGAEFVLIFECVRKDVPEGVQILPLSGGGGHGGQQENTAVEDTRYSTARVDLEGLMERVSVQSINVKSKGAYVIAFVNCIVGVSKKSGFDTWKGGVYEKFVRNAMLQTWNRAIVRNESADRTTLTLRKPVGKMHETKIRFAIK